MWVSFDGVIKDACAPSNFPTKNVIRTGFPETDVRMICLFTMSYSRVSRRGAFPAAREENLIRTSGSGSGGARRNRTDDLLLAKQALSQLSYGPAARASLRTGNAGREKDGGPGKI